MSTRRDYDSPFFFFFFFFLFLIFLIFQYAILLCHPLDRHSWRAGAGGDWIRCGTGCGRPRRGAGSRGGSDCQRKLSPLHLYVRGQSNRDGPKATFLSPSPRFIHTPRHFLGSLGQAERATLSTRVCPIFAVQTDSGAPIRPSRWAEDSHPHHVVVSPVVFLIPRIVVSPFPDVCACRARTLPR